MMNEYEIELLDKQRNYKVVKSNALVLGSRYKYSLAQQKMLAYLCSKIKPEIDCQNNSYQLDYEFQISDYINLMGIESTGDVYSEIKTTIKSLSDKSFWLEKENGDETLCRWVAKATTNKRSGTVKYKLDEDLVPFLFALKERYLQYEIGNILNFNSKFSIRMYEILKAYYDMKRSHYGKKTYETPLIEWTISLDDLRHRLMLDDGEEEISYKRYPDFRRYVIEAAQADINKLSDMYFEYEPIKKGRKVVLIKFKIQFKDIFGRMQSHAENDVIFDKGLKPSEQKKGGE